MSSLSRLHHDSMELRKLINNLLDRSAGSQQKAA